MKRRTFSTRVQPTNETSEGYEPLGLAVVKKFDPRKDLSEILINTSIGLSAFLNAKIMAEKSGEEYGMFTNHMLSATAFLVTVGRGVSNYFSSAKNDEVLNRELRKFESNIKIFLDHQQNLTQEDSDSEKSNQKLAEFLSPILKKNFYKGFNEEEASHLQDLINLPEAEREKSLNNFIKNSQHSFVAKASPYLASMSAVVAALSGATATALTSEKSDSQIIKSFLELGIASTSVAAASLGYSFLTTDHLKHTLSNINAEFLNYFRDPELCLPRDLKNQAEKPTESLDGKLKARIDILTNVTTQLILSAATFLHFIQQDKMTQKAIQSHAWIGLGLFGLISKDVYFNLTRDNKDKTIAYEVESFGENCCELLEKFQLTNEGATVDQSLSKLLSVLKPAFEKSGYKMFGNQEEELKEILKSDGKGITKFLQGQSNLATKVSPYFALASSSAALASGIATIVVQPPLNPQTFAIAASVAVGTAMLSNLYSTGKTIELKSFLRDLNSAIYNEIKNSEKRQPSSGPRYSSGSRVAEIEMTVNV